MSVPNVKELLPCPFCGDSRVEFNSGYKCYRVDCGGAGPMYSDPTIALEKWNCAWWAEEVERLKAELFTAGRFRTEDASSHLQDLSYKQKEIDKLKAALHSAEEKLKWYEKDFEDRGHSFQKVQNETVVKLVLAKDALGKILKYSDRAGVATWAKEALDQIAEG